MNLLESIVQERDSLIAFKVALGSELDAPNFVFYKAVLNDLIDRATQAISGNMDIVEMVRLAAELKDFEK